MGDNESVLVELRKIAAWADLQRKMTKWSLIFIAIFIPAMIVLLIVIENRLKMNMEDIRSNEKPDWYHVDQNIRIGDSDKATRIGEELIKITPQQPEAHQRLAAAYLAAGKIEKAREHYAEAVRLFPSEENEKLLVAIDKRIKAENSHPDGPLNAVPPRR